MRKHYEEVQNRNKSLTRDKFDIHREILKKVLDLSENGEIDRNELDQLLEAIVSEATNEKEANELRGAIRNLFNAGIIRTVAQSTPIKDKGLIISSKIIIKPRPISAGMVGMSQSESLLPY